MPSYFLQHHTRVSTCHFVPNKVNLVVFANIKNGLVFSPLSQNLPVLLEVIRAVLSHVEQLIGICMTLINIKRHLKEFEIVMPATY